MSMTIAEWQPIETAPRDGTPIVLKRDDRPDYGEHLLSWDEFRKLWKGLYPGVMGWIPVWWDPEALPPTHWRIHETEQI